MHRLAVACLVAVILVGLPSSGTAQIQSARDLVSLTPEQLTALYQSGTAIAPPQGWLPGQALVQPGSRLGAVASRGAGLVWQGKRIAADGTARNRFFGLPMIKGQLAQGSSWLDGQPTILLDYSQTSRLYRPYRDEIRQVAPGVFLGLMYDRRTSPATFVRFFALDAN